MTNAMEAARAEVAAGQGAKADLGKIPLDLLPFGALTEVAGVLDFGARKYARHNWTKGMAWSRLLGAALRHLFAWARGVDCDPETGRTHLAHAACCILFLIEYRELHPDLDDRFKGQPRPTLGEP